MDWNKLPADIVFTVTDKPHPHFVRSGSDLKFKVDISLREVGLPCCPTFVLRFDEQFLCDLVV